MASVYQRSMDCRSLFFLSLFSFPFPSLSFLSFPLFPFFSFPSSFPSRFFSPRDIGLGLLQGLTLVEFIQGSEFLIPPSHIAVGVLNKEVVTVRGNICGTFGSEQVHIMGTCHTCKLYTSSSWLLLSNQDKRSIPALAHWIFYIRIPLDLHNLSNGSLYKAYLNSFKNLGL